jgi:hypothetical protein
MLIPPDWFSSSEWFIVARSRQQMGTGVQLSIRV